MFSDSILQQVEWPVMRAGFKPKPQLKLDICPPQVNSTLSTYLIAGMKS